MTNKNGLSKAKEGQFMNFVKKIFSGRKKLIIIGFLIILLGFAGFSLFAKKEKEPELQTTPVERGMITSSVSEVRPFYCTSKRSVFSGF